MSIPVGQSLAQPLQARQRSSASCTSADRQPSLTSRPSTISWSTRARPRVESFSSRVATNDGHITPPLGGARHLPTPVHRCTASTAEPWSWAHRSARRGSRSGPASLRSASAGRGSTSTPGLRIPCGSQIAFARPNGRAPRGNTSHRAGTSAPARRRARRTGCRRRRRPGRPPRRGSAGTQPGRPSRAGRSRCARARSRPRSGRRARRRARGDQQRLEVTEVGAEALRGYGGVLPARVGRSGQAAGREPGSVLADPPQGGRSAASVTMRCPTPALAATAAARACASASVSPVTSANSQPPPRGRSGTPSRGARGRRRRCASRGPRTRRGRCASRPGTASAASAIVGSPAPRAPAQAGRATSRTVAPSTTPRVPSLPTRNRATSAPRSGSRCSRA